MESYQPALKIVLLGWPRIEAVVRQRFTVTFGLVSQVRPKHWDHGPAEEADYILVPLQFTTHVVGSTRKKPYSGSAFVERADLRGEIAEAILGAFPLWGRFPEKHIFFDHADTHEMHPLFRQSVVLKPNCHVDDADAIPIQDVDGVPDPGEPSPIGEADLDASFQGYVGSHPIRERLAAWGAQAEDLRVEVRETARIFFDMEKEEQKLRRREHFDLMLRSRFVLNPRGYAVMSRRIYETMAHGRIPVLISDHLRLPLERVIDYRRFLVRVPEREVENTGDYIRRFEREHDLAEASRAARQAYCAYFAPESLRRLIETSLLTRGSR
jgi:hypothetical protein